MELITLKKAQALFVSRPTMWTVRRWVCEGLSAFDSRGRITKIRLRVQGEGGRIFTSEEWVNEFKEATSVSLKNRRARMEMAKKGKR